MFPDFSVIDGDDHEEPFKVILEQGAEQSKDQPDAEECSSVQDYVASVELEDLSRHETNPESCAPDLFKLQGLELSKRGLETTFGIEQNQRLRVLIPLGMTSPEEYKKAKNSFRHVLSRSSSSAFLLRWSHLILENLDQIKPERLAFPSESSRMVAVLLARHIEQDEALNTMSTLGGAYSNLGEHDLGFAMRARLNALAQMKIVISAGTVDPFSYQKCCLFIAQAQMQEGLLKQSKAIIQKVFKHNQHQDSDTSKRLVRMCQGLWSRLRKFYLDEREQKEKHKTVPSIVAC